MKSILEPSFATFENSQVAESENFCYRLKSNFVSSNISFTHLSVATTLTQPLTTTPYHHINPTVS
jgi:hypothetical protein